MPSNSNIYLYTMRNLLSIFAVILYISTIFPLQAQNTTKQAIDSMLVEINEARYSNPDKVLRICTQALTQPNASSKQKALILYNYAAAQRLLGDYDGSITTLYEAEILLKKKYNTDTLLGLVYSMIGINYCRLADYNTAIKLNDQAMNIFKANNDSLSVAVAYNNRGIIHAHLNEYMLADKFLKQALVINRKKKAIKQIAANLNNLCIYKGSFKEKMAYINEAIIINKNLGATWSVGENYNNMGKQYYYNGEYQKALTALRKAYNIALSINAKGLFCDNYEYCAMVYSAIGDYKMAFEYQTRLFKLNNELQSVNTIWSIERDIAHKKLTKQQAETHRKQQQYEMKLWSSYLLTALVLICLFFVIALFAYHREKRKKQLELVQTRFDLEQSEHEVAKLKVEQQKLELEHMQENLKHSQKELTDLAVFIQSRNELLEKIQDQLKEGYKMNGSEQIVHLKRINAFIKQWQVNDQANSNILQTLNEKNEDFVNRLMERHPNLTQGEKHLAVLLRVDISTKDIAMLTGTNPKSVNMSRYRLRKSLELDAETDLVRYLQSI